jgi:drug/metabolite transporter (DMT)-like permease
MPARPRLAQILLAFAGIYIIWGTTFLGIALAIRTIPPFFSGGGRFLLAGALMYAWLRARHRHPFAGLHIGGSMLCGVLLTGMGNGFVVWSQQGLPSGIASLFFSAMPVSILLLDWAFFSRRAPSLQAAAGVALGFLGIVVLTTHTHSLAGNVRPLHLIAILTAVVAWSLGTLLQRRFVSADQVVAFTCLQMLAGGVFQTLMGCVDREWMGFALTQVSLLSVLAVLYLVAFGSIIAVNCYSFLVAHVAAQKVATYALVNPVIALALGAAILGERISAPAVVSTVLVLAGVALVLFQPARAVSGQCRLPPALPAGIKRPFRRRSQGAALKQPLDY